MCCMIFSELKNSTQSLSSKFGLSRKVNFHAKFGFRFLFHNGVSRKHIFQHKVYRQSSVRFSIFPQNFSVTISINFFRKNRREAFSVSSENMLPTTFRGFAMVGKSKHKSSILHKSWTEELPLNFAVSLHYRKTLVRRSLFLLVSSFACNSRDFNIVTSVSNPKSLLIPVSFVWIRIFIL